MSKSIQMKDSNNEKMYPHSYFPIGSIYLSVYNTNPSKWFDGTWELIAQGRTLVGVDTNDSDFNEPKKTGGAKTHTLSTDEMPKHRHPLKYDDSSATFYTSWGESTNHTGYMQTNGLNRWQQPYADWVGGSKAHNNLQPFFTCYIWCRTA